jgi:hypothetical protein
LLGPVSVVGVGLVVRVVVVVVATQPGDVAILPNAAGCGWSASLIGPETSKQNETEMKAKFNWTAMLKLNIYRHFRLLGMLD